ncbi:hypothetical protein ACFL5T_03125 [Gemmatimonadota bacterium]
MNPPDDFHHPYDTLVSSSLRSLTELIAWIAGPWAISQVSPWLVLPSLVLLVGLPSVFSTRNDKRQVVVPIPGPVRVGLELLLYVVALVAPWFVWPAVVSGVAAGVVIASLTAGTTRILWLMRGAPNNVESENTA